MWKLFLVVLPLIMVAGSSCSPPKTDAFVFVQGGAFRNTKSVYYEKGLVLPDFYMGRYEVTQKEWKAVMGVNPSAFKGDSLPVETVSWYDCVLYCNKRSAQEGLTPYYHIDSFTTDPANTNELDSVKWMVTEHKGADGYRLPMEAEWEYAAGGGRMSRGYLYSGSNQVDDVAWYWKNAGDKYLPGSWSWPALQQNNNRTRPVGGKPPNELGLYDMAGNVREWCWDRYVGEGAGEPPGRVWKGGGWIGADFCCASSFRAGYEASGKGPDQGFRVCRSGGTPKYSF